MLKSVNPSEAIRGGESGEPSHRIRQAQKGPAGWPTLLLLRPPPQIQSWPLGGPTSATFTGPVARPVFMLFTSLNHVPRKEGCTDGIPRGILALPSLQPKALRAARLEHKPKYVLLFDQRSPSDLLPRN